MVFALFTNLKNRNVMVKGIGIFGRKIGMTHIYDKDGRSIPVTLVKTEDCQISQIKTEQTDGYNAIQVAYDKTTKSRVTKPIQGHLKKSGEEIFKKFGEFRTSTPIQYNVGDPISVDIFSINQKVSVTGKNIGKGFSGNQKRHNFHRGPMTHGSKNHRLPGSVGAGSTPGRVYPGKKMAGQLGNTTTTIKTSEILYISTTDKVLILRGSLPGKENSLLKITGKT